MKFWEAGRSSIGSRRSFHVSGRSAIGVTHELKGPMYAKQASLPRLPLPPLEATLSRYVAALTPLLTPEQLTKAKNVVSEFGSATGKGPALQQQLEQLNALTPHSSWMEGLWDSMYLDIRDPSPINVNPGFVLTANSAQPLEELQALLGNGVSPQVARAAQLLEATAKFLTKVRLGELPIDMADKDTPLDMSQYPNLFGATRIPGYNRDQWKHSWSAENYKTYHAVVMCENQFFKIALLNPKTLEPLSVNALATQLTNVKRLAHAQKFNPLAHRNTPVGLLTTLDRFTWYTHYHALKALPGNAEALKDIESALLVCCLDEGSPQDLQEAGQIALHSDGRNRYFDKCIQLIVADDGRTSLNFEHTAFDGHTVLTYVDHIYNTKYTPPAEKQVDYAPPVEQIFFTLDNSLVKAINYADDKFKDFVAITQSSFLPYKSYGKKFITSKGLSPDAYVQAAFQIAQFRTFGKLVSTYESSMVKHFNRGRTETVRSVTTQVAALARSFDKTEVDDQTKVQLLKDAVAAHVQEAKKSKVGECVDRHLQGLKWLAIQQAHRQNGYTIPEIFTDESYALFSGNQLSTSNCGSNALDVFTFGPVISDGLGIGYMIKDTDVPINVTSFQGKAHEFTANLGRTLDDLQSLLDRVSQ